MIFKKCAEIQGVEEHTRDLDEHTRDLEEHTRDPGTARSTPSASWECEIDSLRELGVLQQIGLVESAEALSLLTTDLRQAPSSCGCFSPPRRKALHPSAEANPSCLSSTRYHDDRANSAPNRGTLRPMLPQPSRSATPLSA